VKLENGIRLICDKHEMLQANRTETYRRVLLKKTDVCQICGGKA
jgi:hypothetical protein